MLFYYLIFRSRIIPRWLALWGLVAASLAVVGNVLVIFGYDAPLQVILPNLPFELTTGAWLLVKGINMPTGAQAEAAAQSPPRPAHPRNSVDTRHDRLTATHDRPA